MLRQAAIVSLLSIRNLRSRAWQSLVIVVGMVCVIGVMLSMLSLVEGMRRAYLDGGDPRDAIIVAKNTRWEGNSNIPISQARIMLNAPGIAKAADGAPLGDFSFINGVPGLSKGSGTRAYMPLRGIGPKGAVLRGVHIQAGRMFRAGTHELIAGVRMQTRLRHVGLGDKVIMPDGEWPIVGIFTADQQLDGTLLGDIEPVLQTMRRHE